MNTIITQDKNTETTAKDIRDQAQSLRAACAWLTDVAQVKEAAPDNIDARGMVYDDWRGAIRGEYFAGPRRWQFFCPVWHTGQAIKALVMAHRVLGDENLLEAAEYSAGFLLRNRISDRNDANYGMLFAYEDIVDGVNTSAILEALDGLFELHRATGTQKWLDTAYDALDWVARKTYCKGEGLFKDVYRWRLDKFVPPKAEWNDDRDVRRPLLDDAMFLKGSRMSGNDHWRTIFYEVADRLLADEKPPGNWITYHPGNVAAGTLHPRSAFWWGMPMLDAWIDSGEQRYLDCAKRAARWYVNALRRDGGLFRETDTDFRTPAFGHCTSGVACAAILFQRLIRQAGCKEFAEPMAKAMGFCSSMQMTDTRDKNLSGVILEKVLPPDGTDRLPFHVRDLGTIFYVQALALALS